MRIMLLVICFVFGAAGAAEVKLADGSVVIGTILGLKDSEDLIVDTEYMDEVVIEWEAIESIRGASACSAKSCSTTRAYRSSATRRR
jgi:hypothetical protein